MKLINEEQQSKRALWRRRVNTCSEASGQFLKALIIKLNVFFLGCRLDSSKKKWTLIYKSVTSNIVGSNTLDHTAQNTSTEFVFRQLEDQTTAQKLDSVTTGM